MGENRRRFGMGLVVLVAVLAHRADAAPQSPPKPQTPVFGADVALVAVPVFVVDKNGKSVPGLTIDDFEIEDGGKKVPIVAFQAIDVDAPVTAASIARLADAPVALQAEAPRQFMVLLDTEFSRPEGILRGRKAAIEFIRKGLAPRDLVAVATWGRPGLHVRSNFTSDHESAARSLEGKSLAGAIVSDPLGLAGGFGAIESSGDARAAQEAAELDTRQIQMGSEEYAGRVAAFLEDVTALVEKLSSLRGRKQLVLLSGGFRESGWNTEPNRFNHAESVPNMKRMYRIFEEAGASDLVVHTVSLNGMEYSVDLGSRTGRSERNAIPGSIDSRQIWPEAGGRETLSILAKNTGGRFIPPTNDFGRALHEVDRISRQSYVIAFEAAEAAARGDRPRRLKVRVRTPGLSVSHRPTYSLPSRESVASGDEVRLRAAESITKGLSGGPLTLHLAALPYRDREGRAVVHAVLQIAGDAFSGAAQGSDVAIQVYGYALNGGRVVDSIAANTSLDLSKFGDDVRKSGFTLLTAFVVPDTAVDLRFFARAGGSGLTGSIHQNMAMPAYVESQTLISKPMFHTPLTGRIALPFLPKERRSIEIPFRLGPEPFVPDAAAVLVPGVAREICVFVWPARSGSPPLEVTGEIGRAGETLQPLRIERPPRVVDDADGFDRYLIAITPPDLPSGSHTLRLNFRDPASGRVSSTETTLLLEGRN